MVLSATFTPAWMPRCRRRSRIRRCCWRWYCPSRVSVPHVQIPPPPEAATLSSTSSVGDRESRGSVIVEPAAQVGRVSPITQSDDREYAPVANAAAQASRSRRRATAEPSEMVSPEIVAVALPSTMNTRFSFLPQMVTAFAPGTLDHHRPGSFAQFQRAVQRNPLWRGGVEDRWVEPNHAACGIGVGVGLVDGPEQVSGRIARRGVCARPAPCRSSG